MWGFVQFFLTVVISELTFTALIFPVLRNLKISVIGSFKLLKSIGYYWPLLLKWKICNQKIGFGCFIYLVMPRGDALASFGCFIPWSVGSTSCKNEYCI